MACPSPFSSFLLFVRFGFIVFDFISFFLASGRFRSFIVAAVRGFYRRLVEPERKKEENRKRRKRKKKKKKREREREKERTK